MFLLPYILIFINHVAELNILGSCSCKPGFMGDKCNNTCKFGHYGRNCSHMCDCHWSSTESCDRETGECNCKENWHGNYNTKVL